MYELKLHGNIPEIEKWYVHNIFTTNPKWQIITGCYCWGKKVILVLGSNLNQ